VDARRPPLAGETPPRQQAAIEDAAAEFVCPITLELPIEPVTAEDGAIYERDAIEKYFLMRTSQGLALRSPLTNKPMGQGLLPAIQVRNAVERLVRSGAVGGEKAERWLGRLKEEAVREQETHKAKAGDVRAMLTLFSHFKATASSIGVC